ncbi:MAG TPA: hypothetical protein VHO70_09180 [Chitinispirillaceae bacterium]|nr:hypothetical protein [Chitinispirillaceae bacterium]
MTYDELSQKTQGQDSTSLREKVSMARQTQLQRFKLDIKLFCNAHMESRHIRKYCELTDDSQNLLKNAIEKLGLSARAYDRILKVARTIADIEQSDNIQSAHIAEAIQYRSLDRKMWLNN